MKRPHIPVKFGVRYCHGKLLFFAANNRGEFTASHNPGEVAPSWAVDIREIIAMIFVGTSSLFLIWKNEVEKGFALLLMLTGYATGRTVPGGKQGYKEENPSS